MLLRGGGGGGGGGGQDVGPMYLDIMAVLPPGATFVNRN